MSAEATDPGATAPAPEAVTARVPAEVATRCETPQATFSEVVPQSGTIRGILADDLRRPVPFGTILLRRDDHDLAEMAVGPDGGFEFQARPGTYLLIVKAGTLPPGYLMPWRQEMDTGARAPGEEGLGFYSTDATLPPEGGVVNVEVRVFPESYVFGHVVGPDWEPVCGALVRLQSRTPGLEGLALDATTDREGRYQLPSAYPGKYRVLVWLVETPEPAYHAMGRPVPLDCDVSGGGTHELPTIQVGSGKNTIEGIVRDQDGRPFPALGVLCYLARPVQDGEKPYDWSATLAAAVTDAEGRYALERLPDELVSVQVSADFEPGIPLGTRRIATWIDPFPIDLRARPGTVTAPLQVVDQSRPFFFHGRVVLDREWTRSGAGMGDITVTVTMANPQDPAPNAPRRPRFQEARLRVDEESGEFQWACETPHPPVTFLLSAGRSLTKTVKVFPVPNDTQTQDIRFPR